jgi:hypothetical protein
MRCYCHRATISRSGSASQPVDNCPQSGPIGHKCTASVCVHGTDEQGGYQSEQGGYQSQFGNTGWNVHPGCKAGEEKTIATPTDNSTAAAAN